MKLNPFSPGIDGGLLSFQDKSKHLLIKMVEVHPGGLLEDILQDCVLPTTQVNETQECIQVHYSSGIKRIFYSIGILYDDKTSNRKDIENIFMTLFEKYKGSKVDDIIDFQVVYASPLDGDTDLTVKLEKDFVTSINPVSKDIHGIFSLFSINVFNLDMYPEFFSFIEDVAIKMDVGIEIYFFIKRHAQNPRVTIYMIVHGKNMRSLEDILKNLQKTDEFKAVSSRIKPSKSILASLFIRWQVKPRYTSTLDNITEFIKQYPCFKLNVPPTTIEAGVAPSSSEIQVLEAPMCLCATPPDECDVQRFHDSIAKLGEIGRFVDKFSWVAEQGRRVFLVHAIDATALKKMLQSNPENASFELIFADPIELEEFSRILPAKVDGLYSTSTLDEFSSEGLPQLQSTEIC